MKKLILGLLTASTIGFCLPLLAPTMARAEDLTPQINLRIGSSEPEIRINPGSRNFRDWVSDRQLGLAGRVTRWGVRITEVEYNSPAEDMGLEIGDMILAVNNYAVNSTDDWYDARSMSRRLVRLQVRDVRTGYVVYRTARLFR
jgi:predicted metalloprotease with PDZ domain